jgi:hypothetical protein
MYFVLGAGFKKFEKSALICLKRLIFIRKRQADIDLARTAGSASHDFWNEKGSRSSLGGQ